MKIKNIIRGDKHRTAQQDLQELRSFYQQRDNAQYTNVDIATQTVENRTTVLMEAAAAGRLQLVQLLIGQVVVGNNDLVNLLTLTNNSDLTAYHYANNHGQTQAYLAQIMQQLNLQIPGVPTTFEDIF